MTHIWNLHTAQLAPRGRSRNLSALLRGSQERLCKKKKTFDEKIEHSHNNNKIQVKQHPHLWNSVRALGYAQITGSWWLWVGTLCHSLPKDALGQYLVALRLFPHISERRHSSTLRTLLPSQCPINLKGTVFCGKRNKERQPYPVPIH